VADYAVGAARDLPINTDRAWDAGAARARIWDWAGWDANTAPDASGGKTRQAFLVYDRDAADQKGAYRLPFADVLDGRLTAIAAGLRAAASRLPQTQGLSTEVRDRARGVLDGYFARIQEQRAPAHPFGYRVAPVFARATSSDAALLEKIRAQAVVPDAVSESQLLIVRSVISSGEPDSYKTLMDETTLRNYAADAAAGVSVLYGHDQWAIVGRSFSGAYVPRGGRCESECYIPGGVTLGGQSTDEVIRAVELGLLRDVSVGFSGGRMQCTICERSIWDFECPHVPGVEYAVDGKRKPVTCYVRVVDAHLAEYSLVYAGSTPDASVLSAKALQESEAGRLPPETARALETSYRVRLPGSHHAWPAQRADDTGTHGPEHEEDDDDDEATEAPPDDEETADDEDDETGDEEEPVTRPTNPASPPLEERLRTLLSTVVEGEIADPLGATTAVCAELARLRPTTTALEDALATLREQVASDAALLAYGKACFERDVAHALAEGQRALGERFERERWERTLRTLDPEAIATLAAGWTAAGDALFRGGRQTSDAAQQPSGRAETPISPAFASGFRI